MAYLIFNSKAEAVARSEQAGADMGLAYHSGSGHTRYVWGVLEDEGSNRATLEINTNNHLLSSEEQDALVDELPSDWEYTPLEI